MPQSKRRGLGLGLAQCSLMLCVLCALVGPALGVNYRVYNASELTEVANLVNNGTTFEGTTVILEADLDFSGNLSRLYEPIGRNMDNFFLGHFDGQGYTVRNLTLQSSTSNAIGLIGYSKGTIVRNVIIDNTCSVESTLAEATDTSVAGVTAACYPTEAVCAIENSVNLGDITFAGNISDKSLGIAGIVGVCIENTLSYRCVVRNCANYGIVMNIGVSNSANVAGVIGQGRGSSNHRCIIQNCLNFGMISHAGITEKANIGGVLGLGITNNWIENCLNSGSIFILNNKGVDGSDNADSKTGALVGYLVSSTITNSFWDKGLMYSVIGDSIGSTTENCAGYYNDTLELESEVTSTIYNGTSLLDALNAASKYYYLREYLRWATLRNGCNVTFRIVGRPAPIFTATAGLILLPSLANEGPMWFEGWYKDSALTKRVNQSIFNASTTLYGRWSENKNTYTITFDTRGGTPVEPIRQVFGSVAELPQSTREKYVIEWWENDFGDEVSWHYTVPAHNITLHAVWACVRIQTADDLIDFSKIVGSGKSYMGTTVYLEADISFAGGLSDKFTPIGRNNSCFMGTFDGQGHIISDLAVGTLSNYTGLFSTSTGMTLRNVVLDESCTVTPASPSVSMVGGLIGYCQTMRDACIIENCVSMASITISTAAPRNIMYVGSIAGWLYTHKYQCAIRNVANYGNISFAAQTVSRFIDIGGIAGSCTGSGGILCLIHNLFNAGALIRTDASKQTEYPAITIGGIIGRDVSSEYKICVNVGPILVDSSTFSFIGAITGRVGSATTISHCFWVTTVGCNTSYGAWDSHFSIKASTCFNPSTLALCEDVTVGTATARTVDDALNLYAEKYYVYDNFTRWGSNPNASTIKFTISGRTKHLFVTERPGLFLLPGLAPSGNTRLNGWYTDPGCKVLFEGTEFVEDTSLYAKWKADSKHYTLTFDTLSRRAVVPVEPIMAKFTQTVALPQGVVAADASGQCTFRGWLNKYGERVYTNFTMPGKNLTLYAAWFCKRIIAANEFYEFSRSVNTVPDFLGADVTIYLDADIDFSESRVRMLPVGSYSAYDDNYYFKGTFDGNGYTVHNLMITSREIGAGLFGYSFHGTSIRNVVLDASCSIDSVSNTAYVSIGSILGYCVSGSAPCSAMNIVNLATVRFTSRVSDGKDVSIGGIVGYCAAYFSECITLNCANYGNIVYNAIHENSQIGGISGQCYSYTSENKCRILNNINFGNITRISVNTEHSIIGGIVGYSKRYNVIKNCVNLGTAMSNGSNYNYLGSFVGYLQKSLVSSCFYQLYSSSISHPYGSKDESTIEDIGFFRENDFTVNGTSETIAEALNSHSTGGQLAQWTLNKDRHTVTFMLNKRPYVSYTSQVILVPTIALAEKMIFRGWFTTNDSDAETKFPGTEFQEDTTLWGYLEPAPADFSQYYVWFYIGGSILAIIIIAIIFGFVIGTRLCRKMRENKEIRELIEPLLYESLDISLNDMHSLYPPGYVRPSLKAALVNAGFSAQTAASIARECYRHADDLLDKKKKKKKMSPDDSENNNNNSSNSSNINVINDCNLTADDIAAIALYTMDIDSNVEIPVDAMSMDREQTPYRLINTALADGTEEALEPVKDILHYVMTALRKLPIVHGKPLYRGIRSDVGKLDGNPINVSVHGITNSVPVIKTPPSQMTSRMSASSSASSSLMLQLAPPKISQRRGQCVEAEGNGFSTINVNAACTEGEEIVWRAISSTSPDMKVTKAFLANCSASGKAEGTLFIIEDGWGYDVQPFSLYPDEEEIVLEPERLFKVTSVISGEGLTIIRLEMLKTPLVLTNVFGQKKLSLI